LRIKEQGTRLNLHEHDDDDDDDDIAFFNILHSKKYFQAKLLSLLGYIFYTTYVILYSETFFGQLIMF